MKKQIFLSAVSLFILLLTTSDVESNNNVNCTIPEDNMNITQDTTFCTGDYMLSKGIRIGSDNITLNCNGARLKGGIPFESTFGIRIGNRDNITVENCHIIDYGYGISTCHRYRFGKPRICFPLSNSRIVNNNINTSVFDGIFYAIYLKNNEDEEKSKDNIISGNIIFNGIFGGILLDSIHKSTISNNVVYKGLEESNGIILNSTNKNIIFNNTIIGRGIGAGVSIALDGRQNSILNNTILGNLQFNGDVGILVNSRSDFLKISGNTVTGLTYGIHLINPSNLLIITNNISTIGRVNIIIDGTLGENVNISLNDLLPDFQYHRKYIVNNANKTLNAENNYFGTTNPFIIRNKIQGPVDYCPLLDAPYPDGNTTSCTDFCQGGICPKP